MTDKNTPLKYTIDSPDTLRAYLNNTNNSQRQDGVSDQLIDLVKVFDGFSLTSVSDAILIEHPDARKSPSPRYSTLLNDATVDTESLKFASHCGHTISDQSLSVFIANQLGCYDAADWIKPAGLTQRRVSPAGFCNTSELRFLKKNTTKPIFFVCN